eukprot:6214435-Pleurochrysis_carterae.AAC.4
MARIELMKGERTVCESRRERSLSPRENVSSSKGAVALKPIGLVLPARSVNMPSPNAPTTFSDSTAAKTTVAFALISTTARVGDNCFTSVRLSAPRGKSTSDSLSGNTSASTLLWSCDVGASGSKRRRRKESSRVAEALASRVVSGAEATTAEEAADTRTRSRIVVRGAAGASNHRIT